MLGYPHPRDRLVEHAAQCDAIDISCVYTKADDAPSELVHDHEHPVALQKNGFTPKQINAPEAVLRVPDEGQPRRSTATGTWPVMCGEDTSNDILIDVYSECFGNLLSDSAAANAGIALLQLNDGLDEFP